MSLWYSSAYPFCISIWNLPGLYFGVGSEIGIQLNFQPPPPPKVLVSWRDLERLVSFISVIWWLQLQLISGFSFLHLGTWGPTQMQTGVHQKSTRPQPSAWVTSIIFHEGAPKLGGPSRALGFTGQVAGGPSASCFLSTCIKMRWG